MSETVKRRPRLGDIPVVKEPRAPYQIQVKRGKNEEWECYGDAWNYFRYAYSELTFRRSVFSWQFRLLANDGSVLDGDKP